MNKISLVGAAGALILSCLGWFVGVGALAIPVPVLEGLSPVQASLVAGFFGVIAGVAMTSLMTVFLKFVREVARAKPMSQSRSVMWEQ